jgi:hypothetical protein
MIAYQFFEIPLVRQPPRFPLPDPIANSEWYSQTWIKYPLTHTLIPTHFPLLFKAQAEFRVIMNEICLESLGDSPKLTSERAKGFFLRLTEWYDNLPEPLSPREIVLPEQFYLQ